MEFGTVGFCVVYDKGGLQTSTLVSLNSALVSLFTVKALNDGSGDAV